jgi:hypothetical protein
MDIKSTLRKTIYLFFCAILLGIITPKNVYANAIAPPTSEYLLTTEERRESTLTFKNNSRKEIFLSPVIYSYDPQTLEMSKEDGFIFTRADKEIFSVRPTETFELPYEVVPDRDMRPGTYFNLIILEAEEEKVFVAETNPIGTIENLSHLVVLHITDPEKDVKGISSEFAKVDIEIIDKGIPFISPTVIKYTYENISNYVLNPMGEIQFYSTKGRFTPEYIKINKDQQKLYPGGLLEEEFEIQKDHISNLFTQRMILGRFYNGIDENLVIQEVVIQPNFELFIAIALLIVALIALIKGILDKRKKLKPTKSRKKRQPKRKKTTKKNPE